jgi:hypothetical protein
MGYLNLLKGRMMFSAINCLFISLFLIQAVNSEETSNPSGKVSVTNQGQKENELITPLI